MDLGLFKGAATFSCEFALRSRNVRITPDPFRHSASASVVDSKEELFHALTLHAGRPVEYDVLRDLTVLAATAILIPSYSANAITRSGAWRGGS